MFRCKECGKTDYFLPSRKWHWKLGGEKCYGEFEQGQQVFIPDPEGANITNREELDAMRKKLAKAAVEAAAKVCVQNNEVERN